MFFVVVGVFGLWIFLLGIIVLCFFWLFLLCWVFVFFVSRRKKKPLIKQFSVNGANAFDENKLQNENKNSALVPSCTSPACLIFSIFHKWVFIHPCDLPMVAEIYYQGELAPVTWNVINGFVTIPINCIMWTSIITLICNLLKTSRRLVIYNLPLVPVTSNYIIAFHFVTAFALHNSFRYLMWHGSHAD